MSKKSTDLQLPVKLTEAERIEINAGLARELLANNKYIKEIADSKEAIKTHEGNIALALKELEDNTRWAQVRCEWILYPVEVVKKGSPQIISEQNDFTHDDGFTGIKRLIREDTKGIVDEIEMDPLDFQHELPLEEMDGNKKTKKA